jgi:hypothetical protein
MSFAHFHAVRFYDSEAALCRIVASFLREGLALGQPALVIATPEHSQGIIAELRARELNIKALRGTYGLIVLEAQKTMDSFMVNGRPDTSRFTETVTAAIDMTGHRGRTPIRAYSEMVDVLWKDGRDEAAIQLEVLWNKVARTRQFSLLCGYAMGNFYKQARHLEDVYEQHTQIIPHDTHDAKVIAFDPRRVARSA